MLRFRVSFESYNGRQFRRTYGHCCSFVSGHGVGSPIVMLDFMVAQDLNLLATGIKDEVRICMRASLAARDSDCDAVISFTHSTALAAALSGCTVLGYSNGDVIAQVAISERSKMGLFGSHGRIQMVC